MEKLELIEANSTGDSITAEIDYEGKISLEIMEPWAGDTETGFGRSGAIRLSKEQALELMVWLHQAVKTNA
jgi:hypothetical protein